MKVFFLRKLLCWKAGVFSSSKRIDLTDVKDASTFEIIFELVVQLKLLFRFQVVNLQMRQEKLCQMFFRRQVSLNLQFKQSWQKKAYAVTRGLHSDIAWMRNVVQSNFECHMTSLDLKNSL